MKMFFNLKLLIYISHVIFPTSICSIFFNYRKKIIVLLSIELSFLSLILMYIIEGAIKADCSFTAMALFILGLAAVESALFLGLLIAIYKDKKKDKSLDV